MGKAEDELAQVVLEIVSRHAPDFVFDAFCRSRLAGDWGQAFGTLPAGTAFDAIVARAMPT